MASLATTYWSQNRWDEAVSLEMQLLEIHLHLLEPNHPNTLSRMANLVHTWTSQVRDEDVIALMMQASKVQIEVLGVDHPATRASAQTVDIWLASSTREDIYGDVS
jgi:hypothetical protein